ncbi:hypothetical protein TNCV_1407591 [Trichonephila clavipes]|nr:hypothetical protein TNCV_1407591 [Trichonephila clavipes]
MVLDIVVVVSRTEHAVDEEDAAEIDKLLEVAGAVSITELGGGGRIPFDFQRTSLAGLALESATRSGLGRAPALQCRTPSRHHLELQDRRDYTPADRAARTCWSGCLGLLHVAWHILTSLSFPPHPQLFARRHLGSGFVECSKRKSSRILDQRSVKFGELRFGGMARCLTLRTSSNSTPELPQSVAAYLHRPVQHKKSKIRSVAFKMPNIWSFQNSLRGQPTCYKCAEVSHDSADCKKNERCQL